MKKIIKTIGIISISLIVLIFICAVTVYYYSSGIISRSHIEGNVPEQEYFNDYLERDLDVYFSEKNEADLSVNFEVLNDEPIQGGLSFPRYYVWVNVEMEDYVIERGMVYVAAIAGEHFQVDDYISEIEIGQDFDAVCEIYPADVCEKIQGLVIE